MELLCLNAEHRARFRGSNSSSKEKRASRSKPGSRGLCRKQPGAHLPLLLPHHVFVFILPVGIFQLLLPLGIGCRLRLSLPRAGSGRFGVFTLELLGHPSRCSAGREASKEGGSDPCTGPRAHRGPWAALHGAAELSTSKARLCTRGCTTEVGCGALGGFVQQHSPSSGRYRALRTHWSPLEGYRAPPQADIGFLRHIGALWGVTQPLVMQIQGSSDTLEPCGGLQSPSSHRFRALHTHWSPVGFTEPPLRQI